MKHGIIFLMLVLPVCVCAQNTMYFMDRMPQNISYNPAFIPNVKFYFGSPGTAGLSANIYNSGFNYSELEYFVDNLGKQGYNPDEFVNSIGKSNRFVSEIKATIFAVGFKLKGKGYFSAGLSMNSLLSVKANSEIAYLLADYDNLSVSDFPLKVDQVDFLANNYLNLNLTYSRRLNEHLTVGIGPSINFNLLGVKASQLSYIVSLEDSPSGYKEYSETISGELQLGLPVKINPDAINGDEFDMNQSPLPDNWQEEVSLSRLLKNKSLSVNLGATYELDKWTFSASILNLGNSSWKSNGYLLNGSNDNILIKEDYKVKIGIPTKIYIGAIRQFAPKWNYGLVLNNTSYNWGSSSSATLALNGGIGSMLSTSFSYTAGYRFNNVGLGLRLRFLPGTDFFVVTDNLVQALNYRKANQISVAFGVNLSVGVKEVSASTVNSDTSTN